MDVAAREHELGAHFEEAVLEAVPVAVRFGIEVVDAIGAELRDVVGADVLQIGDAGGVDVVQNPVVIDGRQPGESPPIQYLRK